MTIDFLYGMATGFFCTAIPFFITMIALKK